jgi:hypothetical protein
MTDGGSNDDAILWIFVTLRQCSGEARYLAGYRQADNTCIVGRLNYPMLNWNFQQNFL